MSLTVATGVAFGQALAAASAAAEGSHFAPVSCWRTVSYTHLLDNYKQVGDVSVTFGFNKSVLTKADKDQLDEFGGQLALSLIHI